MKIKIGIIGTGGMGRTRLKYLRENPEVEIIGLCDVAQEEGERLAAEHRVKFYPSYRNFLKEDFDGVTISVPNALHAEYALASLKNGRNVCVEYPMAAKVSDAEKMIESAQKKSLILHVGLTDRFEPWILRIKEEIPHAGKPIIGNSQWFGPLRGWYADSYLRGDLFSFLHHHRIDQYLMLFGEVDWVFGKVNEKPENGRLVYTAGTAVVKFKNGFLANFAWGQIHPHATPYEMLCFENASYIILESDKIIKKITGQSQEEISFSSPDPYKIDTDNFIREIKENKTIVPSEEALKTLKVTAALNLSSQKNGVIYF